MARRQKKISSMSVEDVIKTAIELRKAADSSELAFIEFLQEVENSGVWRAAVLTEGTFGSFLTRHHICTVERYSRSCKALQELGRSSVENLGLPASRQAVRVEDLNMRVAVLNSMEAAVKDSGCVLSDWTARKIVQEVTCAPRVRVSRLDELESENRDLRTRIRELEGENAELRERLSESPTQGDAQTSKKTAEAGAR
jgi:hypothetical protein